MAGETIQCKVDACAPAERTNDLLPDLDEFEERAAIIADGCGVSQATAGDLAARQYGFRKAREYYEAIARQRLANER